MTWTKPKFSNWPKKSVKFPNFWTKNLSFVCFIHTKRKCKFYWKGWSSDGWRAKCVKVEGRRAKKRGGGEGRKGWRTKGRKREGIKLFRVNQPPVIKERMTKALWPQMMNDLIPWFRMFFQGSMLIPTNEQQKSNANTNTNHKIKLHTHNRKSNPPKKKTVTWLIFVIGDYLLLHGQSKKGDWLGLLKKEDRVCTFNKRPTPDLAQKQPTQTNQPTN